MYKYFLKSIIDRFFSFILLIILSPILIVITLVSVIINKGNPFFYQDRIGKQEKLFRIIKFKTMNSSLDENGQLLSDALRLTTFGIILRKLSMDELPQLINILKGDMSIIGPRPLLIEYLPLYNVYQKRRHLIKPGITGWAQINGRNLITWNEKFELDIWYLDNYNIFIDLKILLITIKKLLIFEGINAKENETMKKFTGSEKI